MKCSYCEKYLQVEEVNNRVCFSDKPTTDSLVELTLCPTCKNAFDLGWQAHASWVYWDSCDSCGSYSANKVTLGDGSEVPLCDECLSEMETK